MDNGWTIEIGKDLGLYQKPDGWFAIGATDFSLRRCLEMKVDIFQATRPTQAAIEPPSEPIRSIA